MFFRVTSINFDFDSDDSEEYPSDSIQQDAVNEALKVWEVEDEDELVDVISDNIGWCVNELTYEDADLEGVTI